MKSFRLFAALFAVVVSGPSSALGEAPLVTFREAAQDGATTEPPTMSLSELIDLALERNPQLQQVALEIEAAQGRALQAGLYPNPTLTFGAEEVGPNGGIQTLPQVTVPIVTAQKLRLSRAVALKEVGQAQLALYQQRFILITEVRRGYYELLALQRRIDEIGALVGLMKKSYATAKGLFDGKLISKLDVLPFQVELEELEADLAAAERQRDAMWRRLVASIGAPSLPITKLRGDLEAALPTYDFPEAQRLLLQIHPAIARAEVGIERARLAVDRAFALGVPNVSVGVGYQRNFNDKLNQATYQIQVPIPLFNRNQGNVRAAQAQLAQADQEVRRTRQALTARLADAFGDYQAARQRAERYRRLIVPKANRAYELSLAAFGGQGKFEYLRVLQAQQALRAARLSYVRYLMQAWQAASELSGLLLEEQWPPR